MSATETPSKAPGTLPKQMPLSAVVALPGMYLGLAAYTGLPHPDLPAPVLAVTYGVAIIGAAFLLSWAAEAAQVDISAGLALALLALLAVLPEYAVDFVFTVKCGGAVGGGGGSGGPPEVCTLALANMTGANRVLVGLGWPLVVLVAAVAVARRAKGGADRDEVQSATTRAHEVRLAPVMSVDVAFLGLATLYSLTLPLKTTLTLVDFVVFVGIFAAYAWRLATMPTSEPDLLGVSAYVGHQDKRRRRMLVAGLFTFAALVILASAEHFAESLVDTGKELGISQFLLVQWVAPLASESPELLVACLYAWRLKAGDSLGALLSSKVNQWTLLVGGLPLIFALSATSLDGLPLDTEQRFELLITASQSLFAVAILLDRRLTAKGAGALLGLFLTQFVVSIVLPDYNRAVIIGLSAFYLAAAVVLAVRRRQALAQIVRDGFRTDMKKLPDEPE